MKKLRKTYNELGDDIKAKEQFILNNKSAFNQLGVSINTVNDADNAFITNTAAFKGAVKDRAMAIAAMELAAEKYKSAMLIRAEVESSDKKFCLEAKRKRQRRAKTRRRPRLGLTSKLILKKRASRK